MVDKKLETLAYRLRDLNTLRNLFSELNFDFADKPVNKDNWNDEQKRLVREAKIIASKDDYQIYYIQTNTDSLKEWKGVSSKIIKDNNGLCMICSHNPSGIKWVFSSLSKDFTKSFSETRHVPIDIDPDKEVPSTFVEFLEKIKVEKNSTSTSIASQISDAFDSFAVKIHNELTVNVFEALKVLSEGIIGDKNNNLALTDDTLRKIREPIFILLYRIIFILYAEDRGIFSLDKKIYQDEFSLKWIKEKWLLKSVNTKQLAEYDVDKRLKKLFRLIEIGSEELGYSKEEFFMRSYYGRIFDRKIYHKLEEWKISNSHFLEVLNLVTRTRDKKGNNFFLDYSALDTRQLGWIYEHLLEFHLCVKNKKIVPKPHPEERKITGSYYTPEWIVNIIVESVFEPVIDRIVKESKPDLVIEKILSLKILDPAMGSGHFLVAATNYLATKICEIEGNLNEQNLVEKKRDVVRRCIYGVDLNPLAVDLAKLSLWLETLSSMKPLTFLSSHLKQGNSLIGDSLESVFERQETLFENTSREKLRKSVKDFIGFELLEDDTPSAVKAKTEKFQKIQSSGSFHNQMRGILDHKLSEEFGIKLEPWKDLRSKIGVEGMDFYLEKSGTSVSELRNKHGFFHWDLEFLEVFYNQDGIKKENSGFDIIIGNPPYITTRKIPKEERDIFWQKYDDFLKDEMNTFTLFFAKTSELIQKNGIWGYITPSGWYTNNPYEKLRKWFFTQNTIKKIVDFPYKGFPFTDASLETSIIIADKSISDGNNLIQIFHGDKEVLKKVKRISDELLINKIKQKSILDVPKYKLFIGQTELTQKLTKIKSKFGDVIEIHNPSSLDRRTRYPKTNKQYNKCVFDEDEIRNDSKLKKICKPCLLGEDIQRFFCINVNRFTNIKWKENGIEKQLNANTLQWMNQVKIVGQRITGQTYRRMIFSIDLEGRITMPSANIVLLKDYELVGDEERLKMLYYLQAVLNSKLINYFYAKRYGEANTNVPGDVIEELPLILQTDKLWEKSKKLSNLYAKNNNKDLTKKIESEIDSEIYGMYGLEKSEIEEVENNTRDLPSF